MNEAAVVTGLVSLALVWLGWTFAESIGLLFGSLFERLANRPFAGVRPVTGTDRLLEQRVVALSKFDADGSGFGGWVRVHGERWRATCARPVEQGDHLIVRAVNGLVLATKPLNG